MDIESIRNEEFPVCKNLIYLNHAGVSPIPVRAATRGVSQIREYLNFGAFDLRAWIDISNDTRRTFARLAGATEDEIAFIKNTSEGLSFIAGGLTWVNGDNIVTTSYEFPANIYPWLALKERGVEVRMVEPEMGRVPAEKIFQAVDGNTRLISISSVEFINGFRHDLERMGAFCRKKGILFCVDAIQSLGVVPMDVEAFNIDFLAADGHKWLLSIEGIGCLYVSNRVMERLKPIEFGWHSVKNRFQFESIDFELDTTARKYEPGSFNLLSISTFNGSLNLIEEIGVVAIQERVLHLLNYLREMFEPSWELLSSMKDEERSGILTFRIPGIDGKQLNKALHERKVVASARGGGIRVSPHFYNTREEMDAFIELLRESIKELEL